MNVLRDLFGPGTWGTGGNLVAWVLCGAVAAVGTYLLRNRIGPALSRFWKKHHGEPATAAHVQAAVADAVARMQKQTTESHAALLRSLDRRNQEVLDRVDTQAEATKAHVAAVVAAIPVPPAPAAPVPSVPPPPSRSKRTAGASPG